VRNVDIVIFAPFNGLSGIKIGTFDCKAVYTCFGAGASIETCIIQLQNRNFQMQIIIETLKTKSPQALFMQDECA
jgi:hypothetical protein